ncbi:MAG: DUF3240 family protein [Pseudomonadales bacterium]
MSTLFDDVLVVFSVRPVLHEALVDWLLSGHADAGFSSVAVEEHNAEHDHLSAAEKVRGFQRRVQLQVRIPADRLDGLLGDARREFPDADVHYWVLPLLDGGHLNPHGAPLDRSTGD